MTPWSKAFCLCLIGALFGCSSQSVNDESPGGGAGGGVASDGGWVTGGSGGSLDGCVPKTCEELAAECGSIDDGCGAELSCGSCGTTACSMKHECCPPIEPIDAFDGAMVGIVCELLNALKTDGNYTGLDYADTGVKTIDGESVTACVAVDFGDVYHIDSVVVRARIAGEACSVPCSGSNCGTLNTMRVFSGITKTDYQFVATVTLAPTYTDQVVPLAVAARYVLVCRPNGGGTRDDIVVDSVNSVACQ